MSATHYFRKRCNEQDRRLRTLYARNGGANIFDTDYITMVKTICSNASNEDIGKALEYFGHIKFCNGAIAQSEPTPSIYYVYDFKKQCYIPFQ